jgi:hypothetical protein
MKTNSLGYITDITVTLDDLEFDTLVSAEKAASDRRTYLHLEITKTTGIAADGQDWKSKLDKYTAVTNEATDRLEVTVRKLYVEDDSVANDPSDTDQVYFRVASGAIWGNNVKSLVNGEITFDWCPAPGSGIASCYAEPGNNLYGIGMELLPSAQLMIQMGNYT